MNSRITLRSALHLSLLSAAVFFAALCALLNPAAAMADESMAHSINDDGTARFYYTTDAAIQAGYDGRVIYLDCDWNFTGTMTIDSSKKIVIDMNGHKIDGGDEDTVIRLKGDADLTLQSSKTASFAYEGYSNEDGSKIYRSIMTGGLITNGNSSSSAGGIYMDSGSTLTLDNVMVSGNYGSDVGGIYLAKDNTIYMKNGATVSYNKGKSGALLINGDDSSVYMDDGHIDYNYASKESPIYSKGNYTKVEMGNNSTVSNNFGYFGGAFVFSDSYFDVYSNDKTGVVAYNKGGESADGGAFCIVNRTGSSSDEGRIEGLTITGNSALTCGAMYIGQENIHVNDCVITYNSASAFAGGIEIANDDNVIKDCTITNNVCDTALRGDNEGGGVYVLCHYDITLSGVCMIRDNTRAYDGSDDDLFLLDTGGYYPYIRGGVDAGSLVGIRTNSTSEHCIGKDITTYTYGTYFSDTAGCYVSHGTDSDGDLWLRSGATGFLAKVNGEGSTRYDWKSVIVADGASTLFGKRFWYWDANASTGLSPVSDYINSSNKYNQILTYTMPQNDTNLVAVYADYAADMLANVEKPVAGEELPVAATLSCKAGDARDVTLTGQLTWYEVAADGTRTVASGAAKYGKTYVASVSVEQQNELGVFFKQGTAASEITVRNGSDASTDAPAAAASVDDSTGTLTFETSAYTMEKARVANVEDVDAAATVGTSVVDLLAALPASAVVKLADGSEAILATDTSNVSWPSGLISDDAVAGEVDSTYAVTLPLTGTDEVDAGGKALTVNIKVLDSTDVADPLVSPCSGTYTAAELGEDMTLTVSATCSTKNAKIKYQVYEDEGWGEERDYPSTGVSLKAVANDQTFPYLRFWAEKQVDGKTVTSGYTEVEYTLDDTLDKSITVNCADVAPFSDAQGAWSSNFKVTANLKASVTLTAPVQAGRTFYRWVWDDAPKGTDLTQETLTITDFQLAYDGKIKAEYIPTVTAVDVKVAVPIVHNVLAGAVESATATTADGITADVTQLLANNGAITWSHGTKAGDDAEHSTAYSASVALVDKATVPTGSLKLKVNGQDIGGEACIAANAEGKKTLVIGFPTTAGYAASSVEQPQAALSFADALACQSEQDAGKTAAWGLPSAVRVACACGCSVMANVVWNKVEGFDAAQTSEQELTATGTVNFPEDVDAPDALKTVTAAVKVAAPTGSGSNGDAADNATSNTIAPAKVTGFKVKKAGKHKVKLTWKKTSGRDGVQIRYSLKKGMKKAKTKTKLVKGAKAKKLFKKLKSGKKYYFQVRAYKVVNGKKAYSVWSAKKAVKVK